MFWAINRTMSEIDPFEKIRSLQKEVNKLFEGAGETDFSYPSVNIWCNENEAVLEAEIPGVDPKHLNISIQAGQVTLEGERREEKIPADAAYHRKERGSGRFIRVFNLPFAVDAEKSSASQKNGVLRLTMPRSEESKPKKITVTGE